MNSEFLAGIIVGTLISCFIYAGVLLYYPEDLNDVKLCTIKLNDANNYSSYLTGPCSE